jgi:signal transduction histidine kinase
MPKRWRDRTSTAWSLFADSLSGRLLLLTLLLVMAGEIMVFVPALARFYVNDLERRVVTAELAILPFTAPGSERFSPDLRRELLSRADAAAVMLKRVDQHQLFLMTEAPAHVDLTLDLGHLSRFGSLWQALACLTGPGRRTLLLEASTRIRGAQGVELVIAEAPLHARLVAFAWELLGEAVVTALAAGGVVYLSLYLVVVRPLGRLMRGMTAFRENPEDPSRIMSASGRSDEIGRAERELAAMQGDLYASLQQKARLAALGTAVAKIQHDLRNILSSAQLASDRLSRIDDPVVQHLAPRLVAALDRAVALATSTLRYGRVEERAPQREAVPLAPLIRDVIETSRPGGGQADDAAIVMDFDPALRVDADPEQLFRILLNLVRNARQCLAGRENGTIRITARRNGPGTEIDISDTGPGIPEAVMASLFQPFGASGGRGGSGLGLAIARELARAHGGDVTLGPPGSSGTTFRIAIPDRSTR